MAASSATNINCLLKINAEDVVDLPPQIRSLLKEAECLYYAGVYQQSVCIALALKNSTHIHIRSELYLKVVFLLFKCSLEMNDFKGAKELMDVTIVTSLQYSYSHIFESYICLSEIDMKRRGYIAGIFVIFIAYRDIKWPNLILNLTIEEKINHLKDVLLNALCCEVHMMVQVLHPLFEIAKVFLDNNNPSLANAIFDELMDLSAKIDWSDQEFRRHWIHRLKLNRRLACSKTSQETSEELDLQQTPSVFPAFDSDPSTLKKGAKKKKKKSKAKSAVRKDSGESGQSSVNPSRSVSVPSQDEVSIASSTKHSRSVSVPSQDEVSLASSKKHSRSVSVPSEDEVSIASSTKQSEDEKAQPDYASTVSNESTGPRMNGKVEKSTKRYSEKHVKIKNEKARNQVEKNVTKPKTTNGGRYDAPKDNEPLTESETSSDESEGMQNLLSQNRFSLLETRNNSSGKERRNTQLKETSKPLDAPVNDDSFTLVKSKEGKTSGNKVVLPNGVVVICEHYQSGQSKDRVCSKNCESKCFFAFFNQKSREWIKSRPYRPYLRDKISSGLCQYYREGRKCLPSPSYFLNDSKRRESEPTKKQKNELDFNSGNITSNYKRGGHASQNDLKNSRAHSSQKDLVKSGAHASQKDLVKSGAHASQKDLVKSGAHASQKDLVKSGAHASQKDLVKGGAHASQKDLVKGGAHASQKDLVKSGAHASQKDLKNSGAHASQKDLVKSGAHASQKGLVKSGAHASQNNLKNSGAHASQRDLVKSGEHASQNDLLKREVKTSQSSLVKTQPQATKQTICLPKGISIICSHIPETQPPTGFPKRIYLCDQCSKLRNIQLKYAFWSKKFSRWIPVRNRPTCVLPNTPFQDCKDFVRGKKCTKSPCTFAHGPEITMWTMEREGVLVPAERAINCHIKDETLDRGSIIRPLPQVHGHLKLCKSVDTRAPCIFGRVCPDAHSIEELSEWKRSYEEHLAHEAQTLREPKVAISQDNAVELPRRQPYKTTGKLAGVELRCEPSNHNVTLTKAKQHQWRFTIRFKINDDTKFPMIFLGERHSGYFRLKSFTLSSLSPSQQTKPKPLNVNLEEKKLLHFKPSPSALSVYGNQLEIKVVVGFSCGVFGSFAQSFLVDFGKEPILKKDFNIDVLSKEMQTSINELVSARERVAQADFAIDDTRIIRMNKDEDENKLVSSYSLPKEAERIVSAQMVYPSGGITPDQYVQVMHQLLYAEEDHMKILLTRLGLSNTTINIMTSYSDDEGFFSSQNGEFFGTVHLVENISPDDMAGRVCIRKVQTVLLGKPGDKSFLYEVFIEKLEEKRVIVRLPAKICHELKIEQESEGDVQMWFHLNRTILCRMHRALDYLNEAQKRLLFPVAQPVRRKKEIVSQWLLELDKKLNENQLQVISAITEIQSPSAPLVVYGPFGTGKTMTLNHAILHLVTKASNRVLLCTHTNSSADIHVELLDKHIGKYNKKGITPLRLYDTNRKLNTVSKKVQKYCLIKNGSFTLPTQNDIDKYKVIITTLMNADVLNKLDGVRHGFFTHILIDEAAQAWEAEALIPITLAGPNTKLVFTGDHTQMGPEVYTKFSSQYGLEKSLPERLFDDYHSIDSQTEKDFHDNHLIFLNVNYRNNSKILKFLSENFYEGAIVAMGDEECRAHPKMGPMMFFTSHGRDEKIQNEFLNAAEVFEVVEIVRRLESTWPEECWGKKDMSDVAVIAPYTYQVKAIRGELRKIRLGAVKVGTIHNVQGMEFRALIVCTVRTRSSIKISGDQSSDGLSLEFMSDPRLLVTAISRARSFVAVVGEPVSLCTIGECRFLWRDFITRCSKLNALHGITMDKLRIEYEAHPGFSKNLNPNATVFVPRKNIVKVKEKEEEDDFHENAVGEEKSHEEIDESDELDSSFQADDEFSDDELDRRIEDPPKKLDKIVNALIKRLQERANIEVNGQTDSTTISSSDGSNFPGELIPVPDISKPAMSGFSKEDFEMVYSNSRHYVRLVTLYNSPSERAIRTLHDTADNDSQDHLSREELLDKLHESPSQYTTGRLRVGTDRSYIEFPDKHTPDVKIKGYIRKAFDQDTVVVDMEKLPEETDKDGTKSCKKDCVIGILNHIINPRERQYVCKLDDLQYNILIPTNRSVRKFVNLSLEEKVSMYKKITDDKEKRQISDRIRDLDPKRIRKDQSLLLVQFLLWRNDFPLPLGIVLRQFEKGKNINNALKIVDAEYGVRRAEEKKASKEVNADFPTKWTIPDPERNRREKISNAFTIDPEGSRDLDDAVSIDKLGNDVYRVGIHIADVSYFVKPGTALDVDAAKRGTTFYPKVDGNEVNDHLRQNVPMLPRGLSESHCSLLEKKERLTQTIYITLNSSGHIIEFPRTVLSTITSSRCQLTYLDAQKIIEGEIPAKLDQYDDDDVQLLRDSIPLLHSLAQKCRFIRVGSVQHCDKRETAAAHELIEEMMILANRAAGRILTLDEPIRRLTPFKSHPEPKVHRLNKWAKEYGRYAKYHPTLKKNLESEEIDDVVRERVLPGDDEDRDDGKISIFESHFNQLEEMISNKRYDMIPFLLGQPDCSPQLQLAHKAFRRIQMKAEFKCPNTNEDVLHYGLSLTNYVSFTSPIRRYMDIEIHRRLKREHVQTDLEEVEAFCRRSTFIKHNSKKYSKECRRIYFADSLKDCNEGMEVIIDEIDRHSFVVHAADSEKDLFSRSDARISYQDLSVFDEPEEQDDDQEITLKWIVRIYTGPTEEENTEDGKLNSPEFREKKSMRTNLLSPPPGSANVRKVYRVQGREWLQLVEASQRQEVELIEHFGRVKQGLAMTSTRDGNDDDRAPSTPYLPQATTINPYGEEGHFYAISKTLKPFDMVYVQLFPQLSSIAIPTPDIQLFKLLPNFHICVEHRRQPRSCFSKDHHISASKKSSYDSIKDYIQHWKPVLHMELVHQAVSHNQGFLLKSLVIDWNENGDSMKGQFSLKTSYCTARQIDFTLGDLACVRIQNPIKNGSVIVFHCVFISHETEEDSENESEENSRNYRHVTLVVCQDLTLRLKQFLDGKNYLCDVEVIQIPVPFRRMSIALNYKLAKSSNLVESICLGDSLKFLYEDEHDFRVPEEELSISHHVRQCGFYPLNKYQRSAVEKALGSSFTLIQGPPGTGKTFTGVHIAYWFSKQNLEYDESSETFEASQPLSVAESKDEENKKKSKAPPQVLYCGPSNKSVDVVTEYLLRIPGMKEKILRVYGSMIEETEFPIPRKVAHVKPPVSDDELKLPGGQLKDVALHHVIRSPQCPYSAEIHEMEATFHKDKQNREKTSYESVKKYLQILKKAEEWAVTKAGKEIILCTCSTSGSQLISETCNIVQCIVDESGMCMEPEVLVPLTSTNPKQVVLIGDHKQLQPIVTDRLARKMGLNTSMFERLHKEAEMLKIQYRMHEAICDFPSKTFYDGKLQTDESVNRRPPTTVDFWPSTQRGPVVFCHVEGLENSSVVSTKESGAESKFNKMEALKAVQVAKTLVNKYGVKKSEVVILTPYRQQRKVISDLLKGANEEIKVTTVIKSQGSEWEYVIISLVRSLTKEDIDPEPSMSWIGEHLGFITDVNQINVALTRAKYGLCIIGNRNLISLDKTWKALLHHFKKNDFIDCSGEWPNLESNVE